MIAQVPSSYANAVAPFAPLGRQPVGQESAELKISSLKPLEQSAESGRSENRRAPDERANEVGEQERLREGRAKPQEQNDEQQDQTQKRQQETEREVIRELAARDREVRAHEQAHVAVGGRYASSPVYQYVRGPNGISYAVGGEVSISTGAVPGDPQATIIKAQQIRRAANAPAEPSSQDRRVAAEATRLEAGARSELLLQGALEREQQVAQSERQQQVKAQEEEKIRDQQEQQEQREQQRQLGQEQERAASRAALFVESRERNIDINRRLIDIGVLNSAPSAGRFVDKTA